MNLVVNSVPSDENSDAIHATLDILVLCLDNRLLAPDQFINKFDEVCDIQPLGGPATQKLLLEYDDARYAMR